MLSHTRIFILLSAFVFGGCGLIDSDIADFDLSLPEKEIVLDSSQWELPEDENMPALECGDDPAVCSTGISQLCGANCFGACGDENTCDVKVLVGLWHSLDLAAEKPELQQLEGKPLIRLTINTIEYQVLENTMNVDSPAMSVYVAPVGQMNPGDSQAEKVGEIVSIPAGTTVERDEVVLTPDGRSTLARYMKDYTVPFNLIVGSEVDLQAGDPVPTGRLSVVVLVTAVAGI